MSLIKFRVWNNKEKHWEQITATFYISNDGILFDDDFLSGFDTPHLEIRKTKKDFTVVLFTGLIDKNGKEIYIGDIVSYLGYEVQNGKQIRPKLIREITDLIYDSYHLANIISSNSTVEVVGNRFENPELLEQS